jgi:mRNA interferase MazF
MIFMPNYLKNDVILVGYPFSDLSTTKIRPAIIISTPHPSQDVFITPLTSRIQMLKCPRIKPRIRDSAC